MKAPGKRSLGLLGALLGCACAERSFVRLEPEEDLELVALVEGPSGEILSSTPFAAPNDHLEFEVPRAPGATIRVLGLAPEDLEPMDRIALSLGLDPVALRRSQRATRPEGCAGRYPRPRRVWRLDEGVLTPEEIQTIEVGAPWLEELCLPRAGPPPEGFVSAEVILSSCSLCPSAQLERSSACRAVLRQAPNLCGFELGETSLRFDWRGELCAEPGGDCRSIGPRTVRCGAEPEACELEVHPEGFEEADTFATSELVIPATSTAGADVWGFAVGDGVLLRGLKARAACSEETGGWARLETWSLAGQRLAESALDGCEHGLNGPREDGVSLFSSTNDLTKGTWRFEELSDRGVRQAELEIDLESALGLGSLQDFYLAATIWWPEHGRWVILPTSKTRTPLSPVLLLHREGSALVLERGATSHFPEGTANPVIQTNPDGTSSLWIVSGGNLAVLDAPDQELVYRSIMPSPLGTTDAGRPGTDRLGRLDDHVWSAGRRGPTATMWRVDASGGPVAYLSELSGRAEFLARSSGQILAFTHASEGVFVTRLEPDGWRFRPGTIRVVEPLLEVDFPFDSIAQRGEGPIWIIAIDGSVTKVEAR